MVSRQQQQNQLNTAPLHVTNSGTKQRHNSRAFIFVLIGFCLFFSLRYTSRLIEYGEEQLKVEQWEQKIAQAKLDQAELQVYRDYVLSDAYVESVSRRELLMARPGDTLVVVLPEQSAVESQPENGVEVNSEELGTQPVDEANPALVVNTVDRGTASANAAVPVNQLPAVVETDVQTEPVWRQWFLLFSQPTEE